VLAKGNSNGSIASIPVGGHVVPNSTVGETALCRKVQNKAKKNKASDIINKPNPIFKFFCTAIV